MVNAHTTRGQSDCITALGLKVESDACLEMQFAACYLERSGIGARKSHVVGAHCKNGIDYCIICLAVLLRSGTPKSPYITVFFIERVLACRPAPSISPYK